MNEQIYLNWSKVQGFLDELSPLMTKLNSVYEDLADYAEELHQHMLEDSDSETFVECASKYEELLKMLKNGPEARN